jgi:hypothetical protein
LVLLANDGWALLTAVGFAGKALARGSFDMEEGRSTVSLRGGFGAALAGLRGFAKALEALAGCLGFAVVGVVLEAVEILLRTGVFFVCGMCRLF